MTLNPIKYKRGNLEILNQLEIPEKLEFIPIPDVKEAWIAIKEMKTRGAPAIAITGCLALAVELDRQSFSTHREMATFVEEKLNYLVTARPTAVNMNEAAIRFKNFANAESDKEKVIEALENMLCEDISTNKMIGKYGADEILRCSGKDKIKILTHCNTGSLATAGYGTALGVIRSLHEQNKIEHAFCTETRPYNQGSRLTAYELVFEKIPSTLLCDDMVAAAIREHKIDCIVVGADRIAANGDTANKIGTFQLAILAKHFEIPFYVAAPMTTVDFDCENGKAITVEQRSHTEVTHIKGQRMAAPGIGIWNPAFDVTPAELITKIITEKGNILPCDLHKLK